MPLSGTTKVLIDACARAIAKGTSIDVSLALLTNERRDWLDETTQYLTQQVEEHSGNRRTVRLADVALFADHVLGVNLYLVACPYGTPDEKVTELGDDMVLVSFGPYDNGFTMPAKMASREAIEKYRASVAKSNKRRVERQNAEADVKTFLVAMRDAIRSRVSVCPDAGLRWELESTLQEPYELTLETIATMCRKLGITLQALAQDVPA